MGYGVKTVYEKRWFKAGVNAFYAKDDAGSLSIAPDSLLIYPQENLSVDYELALKPVKGMELSAELANSALTRDIRTVEGKEPATNAGVMQQLIKGNASTTVYTAFKSQLNYTYR